MHSLFNLQIKTVNSTGMGDIFVFNIEPQHRKTFMKSMLRMNPVNLNKTDVNIKIPLTKRPVNLY